MRLIAIQTVDQKYRINPSHDSHEHFGSSVERQSAHLVHHQSHTGPKRTTSLKMLVGDDFKYFILFSRLNREDFLHLASLITTVFPNEIESIYYIGAHNCQRPRGKLYDAYNNERTNLAKSGLLVRRPRKIVLKGNARIIKSMQNIFFLIIIFLIRSRLWNPANRTSSIWFSKIQSIALGRNSSIMVPDSKVEKITFGPKQLINCRLH